jgi:two-component system cell cycle response regulator
MPKSRHREAAKTVRFEIAPVDGANLERRLGSLVVVQGAEADLGLHIIVEDQPVVLGREAEVGLPLRDGSTSRRHCQVERAPTGDGYLVRDLGSTNGTRLNGTRIDGTAPLVEGDKIFLGASIVKFTYTDALDVAYLAKLDAMVATDALTGLLSRRRFDGAFAVAVESARQTRSPVTCLVMDMDGLKAVNDTHGHDMGGFCIVEVARILKEVIGQKGAVCRYGGDEFVAFLPGATKTAGCKVGETMRDAIQRHVFERDGIRVQPTLSVGVATFPTDGDSALELFRAADRALYRAKAAGKNQVLPA